MPWARRVDRNHGEVRDTLRQCGWTVFDMGFVGRGCPDLVAARGGQVKWIEVKDGSKSPSRRKLTKQQEQWHALFQAAGYAVVVITSAEDAAQL